MQSKIYQIILILAIWTTASFASEIDSFNARLVKLEDSAPLLDKEINRQLQSAAKAANESSTCSQQRLLDEIHMRLAGGSILGIGAIETYIDENPQVNKFKNSLGESVFKDVGLFESFALHVYGLGTVINLNGNIVGSDKFGHFFWDGWKYYHKAFNLNLGIEKALSYGEHTEDGLFGFLLTGVYSYADLAANLNGMRFYSELTDKGQSVFLSAKQMKRSSLFKCVENKWVVNREFRWRDYSDASWDEGVNCNQYRDQSFDQQVGRRIAQIEQTSGRQLQCPVDTRSCPSLVKKYGSYSSRILHPLCYKTSR